MHICMCVDIFFCVSSYDLHCSVLFVICHPDINKPAYNIVLCVCMYVRVSVYEINVDYT